MKKRITFGAFAAVLTVLLGAWGTGFAQTAVTECGQIVEGDAYLTGDLDCTGFDEGLIGAAILLGRGGRLDLRGFTVTGGEYGVACMRECGHTSDPPCIREHRCTIFDSVGGGVITGAEYYGVVGKSLDVRDITISNHGDTAINADRINMSNATLSGNYYGMQVGRRAKIVDSRITGSEVCGILGGRRIFVSDSLVSNNSGWGILAYRGSLRNVEVTGNGSCGVQVRSKYRGGGSWVGGRLLAKDSTITGNAFECPPDEAPSLCFDIYADAHSRVRLQDTTVGACSGCP